MHWWQTGIIYQIYPRSFQDSNGDGIGDLPGILQKLGYLQWLGVDALWLSPVYPSPMADFGYDVTDYTNIDPMFGTLDGMDALIAAAHARGMKIILDFVPNHSSDQHPWFLDSKSSRHNAKRDWYIWRDPAPDGGPPNNWLSRFDGKSAWEWDETTGQYYLHSFLKEQPDLNWRNADLRAAMLDNLRFWFARGVDGFRVDVSYRTMKDPQFRDNPPNPSWRAGMDPSQQVIETYTKNTPDIHMFNRWLREVCDEYANRVLIGEINLPLPQLVAHYGRSDEFHLPFNFRLIYEDWNATAVRRLADQYEAVLPPGAWPNWVLGNHDQHRIASRIGPARARLAQMLLLTLRGTPTMYYGDEIGMTDVHIPPDRVQDPWEKFVPGIGMGRDPQRTPMQWSNAPHAGFTIPESEPWLPLPADYAQNNVAQQQREAGSTLAFVRRLISLRRLHFALHGGSYRALDAPLDVFLYERTADDAQFLIALNFSDRRQTVTLPPEAQLARVILSTNLDQPDANEDGVLRLRGNEGLLLAL